MMSNTQPFTLYWPREVSGMMQENICKFLGIPSGMTVNRETVVYLTGEQAEKLQKVRERGLLIVRNKMNKM